MALIDDRGRVFGKINLIDFALLVFVALLVPLGYGAYLLFRLPAPQIVAITPNTVPLKSGEQRVKVTGENLRPFMKAALGTIDTRGFLVDRPTSAELVFADMPAGTYDLVLFDAAQEVARMKNAFTITPPPAPLVQIAGRFAGPAAASAKLTPGTKLGDRGSVEIVSIGAAAGGERLATLRTPCDSSGASCVVSGAAVQIGKPIALQVPGGEAPLSFVVDRTQIDATWIDVHVSLFGIAEALDLLAPGDVDRHQEPDTPNPGNVIRGAVVVSAGKSQLASGALTLGFNESLSDLAAFQANAAGTAFLPLHMRQAVVTLPVVRTPNGWKYRDEIIRPGYGLTFETDGYLLRGMILRTVFPNAGKSEPTDR